MFRLPEIAAQNLITLSLFSRSFKDVTENDVMIFHRFMIIMKTINGSIYLQHVDHLFVLGDPDRSDLA